MRGRLFKRHLLILETFSILGILAMSFDTLFMVQHYILYRNSNTADLSGKNGVRHGTDAGEEETQADEETPLI